MTSLTFTGYTSGTTQSVPNGAILPYSTIPASATLTQITPNVPAFQLYFNNSVVPNYNAVAILAYDSTVQVVNGNNVVTSYAQTNQGGLVWQHQLIVTYDGQTSTILSAVLYATYAGTLNCKNVTGYSFLQTPNINADLARGFEAKFKAGIELFSATLAKLSK